MKDTPRLMLFMALNISMIEATSELGISFHVDEVPIFSFLVHNSGNSIVKKTPSKLS